MSSQPLISVIIPVHNGELYLADAISSVRQQSYPVLEIIVVDDGSDDGTAAIIRRYGEEIRAIKRPRRGPAAARNSGLELARGEFIAFLDADDLWPPTKLQTQFDQLVHNPSCAVILGRVAPFGASSAAVSNAPAGVVSVQLGGALFRRTVFDRIGHFDANLRYSEDHDWFMRAREQDVPMLVLDQVTLFYRRHAGNMTASAAHGGYQLARILKASLDRRRAGGDGQAAPLPRLTDFAGATTEDRPTNQPDQQISPSPRTQDVQHVNPILGTAPGS